MFGKISAMNLAVLGKHYYLVITENGLRPKFEYFLFQLEALCKTDSVNFTLNWSKVHMTLRGAGRARLIESKKLDFA